MKKVNFDFRLKDLAGNDIESFNIKEQVANIIAGTSSRSPIRSMEIARKIFNDGEIELPSEDIEIIRNAILINDQITDLVKSQILEKL